MLAFIGGTGLTRMSGLQIYDERDPQTPWGAASSPVKAGCFHGTDVLFLARHGDSHHLLPHQVNYRANLRALYEAGATRIVAVNAVGGINAAMPAGSLVIADQIIDYTWGRDSTFFDRPGDEIHHVDFTWPLDASLRKQLAQAAEAAGEPVAIGACYGVTQGPRLETAAEIIRMERDGCDLVGMTAMPEAVLARELQLPYAMLSLVVNPAAGKVQHPITMEQINQVITEGMERVHCVLEALVTG